jgi:hypothetical protein
MTMIQNAKEDIGYKSPKKEGVKYFNRKKK